MGGRELCPYVAQKALVINENFMVGYAAAVHRKFER